MTADVFRLLMLTTSLSLGFENELKWMYRIMWFSTALSLVPRIIGGGILMLGVPLDVIRSPDYSWATFLLADNNLIRIFWPASGKEDLELRLSRKFSMTIYKVLFENLPQLICQIRLAMLLPLLG